jgi:Uma2 family endonuclease
MNALPARVDLAMTVEEFLAFADARPETERWELIDGLPVMMTNPSLDHDVIVGNLIVSITPRLRPRGCRVHHSVLLRRSDRNDFGAVPDLVIRCGPVDGRRRTLSDAIGVIEVLSPSTMSYDRGDKLRHYLAMQTLRHIALVYQTEMRVEIWTRDLEGAWPAEASVLRSTDERLDLNAVDVSVALSDIYVDTSLLRA